MSPEVMRMLRFLGWAAVLGIAVLLVGKVMGNVQGQAGSFLRG